jgi:hypothetical protein
LASFAGPLGLEPRPSRRLAGLIAGVHVLGLGALALTSAPVGIKGILAAGILWSLIAGLRGHVLRRGRRAIRRAVWLPDGRWIVHDSPNRAQQASLAPGFVALPAVVLVRLVLPGGGRRTLLLLSDSLDRQTLRRLRVRLRLGGRGAGGLSPDAGDRIRQ